MALPAAITISDIHLGDPQGVVQTLPGPGCTTPIAHGKGYVRQAWLDALGRIDKLIAKEAPGQKIPRLVIAGDFWDVAIRNIDEAADLSLAFFETAELQKRFESILFLPGNHDHYLWSLVQMENAVIRPLENLRRSANPVPGTANVHPLPHVQCAVLDLRNPAKPGFAIQGVQPPYEGNIFTTGLTGGRIPVNVAYPDLHVLRADGKATVITHGHFFQVAWTLLSDLLRPTLGAHLPGGMDLYFLEVLNAGLTDFINYAIGQVGPLSSVLQSIYDKARHGVEPPELDQVLGTLRDMLDKAVTYDQGSNIFTKLKAMAQEWGSDRVIDVEIAILRHLVESAIKGAQAGSALPTSRNVTGFLQNADNRAKIAYFLTCARRDETLHGIAVDELVFGHTHESISGEVADIEGSGPVRCWNAGSLVAPSARCDFMPLAILADGTTTALGSLVPATEFMMATPSRKVAAPVA